MNPDRPGNKKKFAGELAPGHRKPWIESYDACVPASLIYQQKTCQDLLEEAAKRFPNHPCTLYKGRRISFHEVDEITNSLASGLQELGLKKGDRVGLLLPNIPQFVIAYYAILKAGGVVVAMNPQSTGIEVALEASETRMKFAIILKTMYPSIKKIQAQTEIIRVLVTTIEEALLDAYGLRELPDLDDANSFDELPLPDARLLDLVKTEPKDLPPVSPDDPAIFQYTGGTTGKPKAAIGLHRNLTANTLQFRKWLWNLEDGQEILLAAIPMFHVYGMVLCLNLAMMMGAGLLLLPSTRNMDEFLGEITAQKPTLFPGVPGLYRSLAEYQGLRQGSFSVDSLKICISGSAPLLPETKRSFEMLIHGKLVEGYGLSEAPTATHCNPIGGQNITGSIGLPLPDVDCVILSLEDGLTELEPGGVGELVLTGPQVMQGYYQNPEETQSVLQNGWLYTGDIARMDSKGYFYIVDRKKDLIKVNGLQVWPHEVEEVLALHPAVIDVGVAGIPDSQRGEAVKAWIVLKPGQTITLDDVVEWCSRSLSRYKIPSQIEILTQLPRTPVGKLLLRELRTM